MNSQEQSSMPLVSIVIPFYNGAQFLRETLESVAKQQYKHWECLLVDDGSTDDSVSIVKEFQQNDSRFHYIRRLQEPKGVSTSRNDGINQSTGKYLLFLDADDILSQDCLENRVGYLEQHSSLDFAVFQVETFGQRRSKMTSPRKNYLEAFAGFDFPWTVSSPFWRTEFLKSLGGFNTNLIRFEDPELHLRALLKSPEFTVLTDIKPDLFYRQWKSPDHGKSNAYKHEITSYKQYLKILPGLLNSSQTNVKILRNGIFLFLTRLIAPLEDWECLSLDNMLDQARYDGILGPIRYRALKARAYLLKSIKSRSFHRVLLVVMQLITSPSNFTSLYGDVLKKKIKPKKRVDALA